MPPKGSQLLSRVLARENDDGRCSSSESENGMELGLTHLAATASAGLRMEMEMLRESRSREKADGVDRDACIVDRQQFFNTQIGVGYQHKKVIRQRTVNSSHVGQQHRVVDMSVAPPKGGREEEGSDGAGKSKKRKKDSKTKSKKKKKEKKKEKDKKAKKDGRGKKSAHHRKKSTRRSKDDDANDNSAQERKRKKKRKREDAREVQGKSDGGSSSSSTTASNSGEESDDSLDMPTLSNMAPVSTPPGGGIEGLKERARLPLQRLRDIIEEKIREKARSKERAESRNTPEAGIAIAGVAHLKPGTSFGAWTRRMTPKEEAGGADRCSTVAAWTTTTNNSGRPPLVASTKSSKVGSHGTAKTTSKTGSTPTLRVRPVLKPSTPTKEEMNPIPPKQSPGAISFKAQSSSVVAPMRDGNAACMLFSQSDLRLPGTAPLSSRSSHGKGAECGRYTPTCGRAKRTRSSDASNSTRECDTAWLPSPASDTAIPSTSCSSPPRLAALSPAALKRPTSSVGGKNKPDGGLRGWSAREDPYCVSAAAAMESREVNKGRLVNTRKQGFESMSPLEKPKVGKTDQMVNHRLARGETQQTRKQKGQAVTSRIDTQEDKPRALESLKSGAHTGMSVAEFADKVATLAAEVAKVFGRKPVSQSANCRSYGLE